MITFKDIEQKYQVTRQTIYSWIKAGMPSYKVGRLVRFEAAEVEAWIKNKK
jgi:excisionase family DNA binding protein